MPPLTSTEQDRLIILLIDVDFQSVGLTDFRWAANLSFTEGTVKRGAVPNTFLHTFICWFNLFNSFFTENIYRGEKYSITILQDEKKKTLISGSGKWERARIFLIPRVKENVTDNDQSHFFWIVRDASIVVNDTCDDRYSPKTFPVLYPGMLFLAYIVFRIKIWF